MSAVLDVTAVLVLLAAGEVLRRARQPLRATTLTIAWNWAAGAWALWILAALCESVFRTSSNAPLLELLWYAAALVSLAASIAVLGARRPGVRAWSWFVLWPLLLVFGWPMLTAWDLQFRVRPWRLETPQLLGVGLVLLMGAGNYVGTRHRGSAGLYALALCLLIAPTSSLSPPWLSPGVARMVGTCLVSAAVLSVVLRNKCRFPAPPSPDRVWTDFRNTFGVVWARGLQDRFNRYAHQERWPVELGSSGFVWTPHADHETRAVVEQRLEASLYWMLRRFVSTDWIDQRLRT